MERVGQEPDDAFRVSGVFECPGCGADFDVLFDPQEGVYEREDLIDAPEMDVECPGCGTKFHVVWGGWVAHEDAG